eukprot:GHVN01095162.1.p1 GENE.GHVN01095162.1~~GHVN01095162.1.p1  ORF type:complete len:572 (+),score=59.63 GHVN01095162.1:146-1861(+)
MEKVSPQFDFVVDSLISYFKGLQLRPTLTPLPLQGVWPWMVDYLIQNDRPEPLPPHRALQLRRAAISRCKLLCDKEIEGFLVLFLPMGTSVSPLSDPLLETQVHVGAAVELFEGCESLVHFMWVSSRVLESMRRRADNSVRSRCENVVKELQLQLQPLVDHEISPRTDNSDKVGEIPGTEIYDNPTQGGSGDRPFSGSTVASIGSASSGQAIDELTQDGGDSNLSISMRDLRGEGQHSEQPTNKKMTQEAVLSEFRLMVLAYVMCVSLHCCRARAISLMNEHPVPENSEFNSMAADTAPASFPECTFSVYERDMGFIVSSGVSEMISHQQQGDSNDQGMGLSQVMQTHYEPFAIIPRTKCSTKDKRLNKRIQQRQSGTTGATDKASLSPRHTYNDAGYHSPPTFLQSANPESPEAQIAVESGQDSDSPTSLNDSDSVAVGFTHMYGFQPLDDEGVGRSNGEPQRAQRESKEKKEEPPCLCHEARHNYTAETFSAVMENDGDWETEKSAEPQKGRSGNQVKRGKKGVSPDVPNEIVWQKVYSITLPTFCSWFSKMRPNMNSRTTNSSANVSL